MATVNILIAVDTTQLADQINDKKLNPGTMNVPTGLGAWDGSDVFISMIAQHCYATNDQGESELTITCKSGDEIQWVIMGFDANEDYTVYLYNGVFSVQAVPVNSVISALSYNRIAVPNYFPPLNDPTVAPTQVKNTIYSTKATILDFGISIQYTLSFALIDNSTGQAIGYFSWDPFINVQG